MFTPLNIYLPYIVFVSDITLGVQTVATFTAPHAFTIGEIVSFRISRQYGTVELNNVQAQVIALDMNSITVPIDSRNFTPFIANPVNPQQLAAVVPSASGVVPGAIPPQTNLEDAFDNVPRT
jgi:hypothetical protein